MRGSDENYRFRGIRAYSLASVFGKPVPVCIAYELVKNNLVGLKNDQEGKKKTNYYRIKLILFRLFSILCMIRCSISKR